MTMSEQRRAAWQSLQGMAVPSAQDIQEQAAQSLVNQYQTGPTLLGQEKFDRHEAWKRLQGMVLPMPTGDHDHNSTLGYQSADHAHGYGLPLPVLHDEDPSMHVAGAPHKPAVYDSSDALLGELLREVLSMAKAMEGLCGEVADLRAEIRGRAQQVPLSQRTLPDGVVGFPHNALRHGSPT